MVLDVGRATAQGFFALGPGARNFFSAAPVMYIVKFEDCLSIRSYVFVLLARATNSGTCHLANVCVPDTM